MKIDTGKITGYDTMSAEEKLAALLAYEIEEPDTTELTKLKTALSKANGEAADFKRKLHEKMSDEEKAKEAAAAAQKELEDKYNALLRESSVAKTTAKYMDLGMDKKLATATAEAAIDGDTDKVFENLAVFKNDFEKSVRADAFDRTPRPEHKGSGKTYTKEEIMAIKDTDARQKAILENHELFGI